MVMEIVGAIVSSMVKYMTNEFLLNSSDIKIKGAPYWYMQPVKGKTCVFVYKEGGYQIIDEAKEEAKEKMKKKISKILEMAIKEKYNDKNFLKVALKDENLGYFVDKEIKFSKIKYKNHKLFLRGCILNDKILEYEKNRLKNLKFKYTHYKSDRAFEELDEDKTLDDKFKELDKF